MRIRKQPRQLPACRDSFLPCSFQEGSVGWSNREYSEVGNGGAVFAGKAPARVAKSGVDESGEHLVAAMAPASNAGESVDRVKPEPDASDMSRMPVRLQPGGALQQGHVVQDVNGMNQLLPGGRHSGKSPSPSMSGLNFVVSSQRGLVACGQSLSPVVNMEATSTVDQMKLPAPSNYLEGSFTQEEDDDDNLTRHYVRRGLRNSGDGVTQHQSEPENIPVKDVVAAIPKVNLPAHLRSSNEGG